VPVYETLVCCVSFVVDRFLSCDRETRSPVSKFVFKMENTMISRIVGTVGALVGLSICLAFFNPAATLFAGQAAGNQLRPSDGAFLQATGTMSLISGMYTVATGLFLLALILIWYSPVKRWIMEATKVVLIAGLGLTFGFSDAKAYYDQKDWTEAYTILPNESAHYVPDTGNNKDGQVSLDSEAYLKANQVAAKRFIMPHTKLSGTGGFFDYYVPAGRLFIVDRTTYSHEWVGSGERGSSKSNESFPCQSKEGLDVIAGVSVGSSVKEDQSARYLYNFGVVADAAKIDRTKPEFIFQSVYYSRKLSDVMNDMGRKKVQTLVCAEIASRTLDQVNADANVMMASIQTKAVEYFGSVGITLNFIGWADTFTFSKEVQKSIDDRFIVEKLGNQLAVLNALANIKVQEGLGLGLEKHGLPVVVTPDMLNILAGLASKVPAVPAGPPVK
jgi:hypothetical protein